MRMRVEGVGPRDPAGVRLPGGGHGGEEVPAAVLKRSRAESANG